MSARRRSGSPTTNSRPSVAPGAGRVDLAHVREGGLAARANRGMCKSERMNNILTISESIDTIMDAIKAKTPCPLAAASPSAPQGGCLEGQSAERGTTHPPSRVASCGSEIMGGTQRAKKVAKKLRKGGVKPLK